MTLRLRNILMVLISLLSVSSLAFTVYLLFSGSIGSVSGNISLVIPILLNSVLSASGCIIIFTAFRNTVSAEILFFFLFVFTLCFEIFKTINLMVPPSELPLSYSMFTTRFVYYGRILGALSLFSAGLFATGLEYQRSGIVFLISIILTAALVWLLPVDTSSRVPGNTWELGKFRELNLAIGFFNILAVFNFIIASLKNENRQYFHIAAGFFLAAAGREILFFFPSIIALAAGTAALVTGALVTGLRTHSLYQWE